MEKKNLKAYVKPATETVKMMVNGELCQFIYGSSDTSIRATNSPLPPGAIILSRKKGSTAWDEDAE